MSKARSFEDEYPHLREFKAFLDLLNKESERGAALIAAAMVDDLLERSLRAFLLDHKEIERLLEGFNAPLGALSARALAAFGVGLLSEREYRECERIRKIRNVFAHNVNASFEDQNTKDICANLEYAARREGDVHPDPKGLYVTACTSLILILTNRPHYASQRRLRHVDWPY